MVIFRVYFLLSIGETQSEEHQQKGKKQFQICHQKQKKLNFIKFT